MATGQFNTDPTGRGEQELLQLHGGDHLGTVLVNAPFDQTDFLAWKRSIVIALRARMKLSFIDGSCSAPDVSADNYDVWIRVHSMVTSWILTDISKKISKAFLYAKTTRQLWLDLEERYGENNGPMVYQLQRAIASIAQGTMSVVDYFNSLSTLWDERDCLMPIKTSTCGLCTCGFTRIAAEEYNLTKLVQFLMGLDDSYDNIRNQILVMDPFPSVNKNLLYGLRGNTPILEKSRHKGKGYIDRKPRLSSLWGQGQTKDTYFKFHGFPNWYKTLKEQKRREEATPRSFNVVVVEDKKIGEYTRDLGEALRQVSELLEIMKGQIPNEAASDPL
ncbi:UNVERIFIED_CONTAM: hypothetical protein Sindi_2225200 [Sesamum indicum]